MTYGIGSTAYADGVVSASLYRDAQAKLREVLERFQAHGKGWQLAVVSDMDMHGWRHAAGMLKEDGLEGA